MIELKVDARELVKLEEAFRRIGNQAPHAIRRALNHTGDKTTTQVKRALAKQTGAKYGAIGKALRVERANYGSLAYVIHASGGAMSLKEFGPNQTARGVSAAPWNKRRVFPHTFGPRIAKLGGHVYVRTSPKRFPIKKLWGPIIPNEMVKDQSAAAFYATVQAELPARLEHEIGAILSGAAPRG